MAEKYQHPLQHQVSDIIEICSELGVYLEFGSNFDEFIQICGQQPERDSVSPAFDPKLSNINSTNGMWILGRNKSGTLVHTQSLKLIDLGKTNFDMHLQDRLLDYRIRSKKVELDNTSVFLSADAKNIQGSITYHGELWLKGGKDGIRGGCLSSILPRLLLIQGLLEWRPDFMFGFQSALTTCRGLGTREGYMRAEQRSVMWKHKGEAERLEEWLVWMSREEAEFNLRVPARSFFNMFERKPIQTNAIVADEFLEPA